MEKMVTFSTNYAFKEGFFPCFVCGTDIGVSRHHIKPISEGGKDEPRNRVNLCEDHHNQLEGKCWEDIFCARKTYIGQKKIYHKREKRYKSKEGRIIAYCVDRGQWRIWQKEPYGLSNQPYEGDFTELNEITTA